jgi:hypothetical protein
MGVDPADLVFIAGRPILVVPPQQDYVFIRQILIAWKDAREARRTVLDSLPVLKLAEEVLVLTIDLPIGASKMCARFFRGMELRAAPCAVLQGHRALPQ